MYYQSTCAPYVGLGIGFEQSRYEADEDAGSVLVCATVQEGPIMENSTLSVEMRTIDGSKAYTCCMRF